MTGIPTPIRPEPLDLSRASLAEIARAVAEKRLPPVEHWTPTHCGDSDMRIAADGSWFHGGTPIGRPALVKLFSTVLRREADGSHVLVTPYEKLAIAVEDAAFLAVECASEGTGAARTLSFRLLTDDIVIAGPQNPLRVETAADGTPRPYLGVRGGMEALINRSVFYQLADWALEEGASRPGLWSEGCFFAIAD